MSDVLLCDYYLSIYSGIGGGYGSGVHSGSGSGSGVQGMDEGDVWSDETDQCAEVMTLDDDEGDSITDSIAFTAISCTLLCMDNVTNNPSHQVQ